MHKPKIKIPTLTMGHAVKVLALGYGRTKFMQTLREKKILDEENVPYQQYLDRGYFTVKLYESFLIAVPRVTLKGLKYLDKILAGDSDTQKPKEIPDNDE